jgi:hypothetical protein
MSPFFLLVAFAAVAWLFIKWREAHDKIDHLLGRFERLENELRRLRREETPPARETTAAPPVSSTPQTIRQPLGEIPSATASIPRVAPVTPPPPPLDPALPPPLPPPIRVSSPIHTPSPQPPTPSINWEKFLGVKLFAWLGGLALFLGVAFFVKYSFEHNLISPQMRVALGYLAGLGLLVGGWFVPRERQAVTAQTLCATGTVILYATIFTSYTYYHFLDPTATFSLMALVTATAFFLAVRLDAQVVAILGLLGGFLTPPMVSTGVDRPLALFGYLGLLDLGLLAVALRKKWNHLTLLAALATIAMQLGWVAKFFAVEKVYIAMGIFLGFTALFVAGVALAHRFQRVEKWISAAAIVMPVAALIFALYLLVHPYRELAAQPVLLFSYVFAVDMGFLVLAWLRQELRWTQLSAGAAVFFLLAIWTVKFLSAPQLNPALCFYLVFTGLHAVFPVVLQRLRPAATPVLWVHFYPALALALLLVPLFKMATTLSLLFWPVMLLIDLMAIALAVITASLLSILVVFVLTVLATALWIFQLPPDLAQVPGMLVIIGGFAVFFLAATLFAARQILARLASAAKGTTPATSADAFSIATAETFGQILSLAALLPFLLLTLVVLRLPLANPSLVFGLAALLLLLLLIVMTFSEVDMLVAVGLGAVLLLEYTWHFQRFEPSQVSLAVAWYAGFSFLFLAFPFLLQQRMERRVMPWAVSALALPLHFLILYFAIRDAFPAYPYLGLVPAVLSVPCLLGLLRLVKSLPSASPQRQALLALFGGASLFFITLIFPIQFERYWITIGWALQGAALLGLFQRVPHPGLRLVGVALLAVSFARLALNPQVIWDYGRSGRPILNWYLYAYGIVTVCLMAGGRLLAPPRHRLWHSNASVVLYSLGVVLAFLLLNIEIADYFSGAGARLTFNFSSNFAQDMTYSLAWALFAFVLLAVGFKINNAGTRYAGMGLLIATLLKLFLHDLWRLGGLYRIGSLIGLAVVLMLVSFIYQRFLSTDAQKKNSNRQP